MTILVGVSTGDNANSNRSSGLIIWNWNYSTAVATGTATKAFFKSATQTAGRTLKALIYDSAGTTLLGESAEYTTTGSEVEGATIEMAISPGISIAAATAYRLCLYFGGTVGYRSNSSSNGTDADSTGNVYPTAPATISANSGVAGIPLIWLEDAGAPVPSITDADDEQFLDGETGIVITGTNFGASQGTGSVKISPLDAIGSGAAVTQTVTAWSDTSITITTALGELTFATTYLFVTNNDANSNAAGYAVSFIPRGSSRAMMLGLG